MMTNFNAMLRDAYERHYAVGSFNIYHYETMRGVLEAAKHTGTKQVIMAFGAKYLENMSLSEVVSMAEAMSHEGVDICLHLDHCKDMNVVYAAIRAGFGSVMYDGSALSFEENAKNTRRICEVALPCGVSVEAELGSIAAGLESHEGEETDVLQYTDPQKAAEFVKFTGVDALAVSIGTVHGLYKGEPNIRTDILERIDAACGIPLVLHGGSGIPEETIRACIARGIAKINVNTEISSHCVKKTAELLASSEKKPHLSVLAKKQQGYVAEVVEKYIRFFAG